MHNAAAAAAEKAVAFSKKRFLQELRKLGSFHGCCCWCCVMEDKRRFRVNVVVVVVEEDDDDDEEGVVVDTVTRGVDTW